MAKEKSVYNTQLMCSVISLGYDFPTHHGYVYFPEYCCCDMQGCIKLFTAIDPDVTMVITFSGPKPDMIYCKENASGQPRKNGEWKAYIAEYVSE